MNYHMIRLFLFASLSSSMMKGMLVQNARNFLDSTIDPVLYCQQSFTPFPRQSYVTADATIDASKYATGHADGTVIVWQRDLQPGKEREKLNIVLQLHIQAPYNVHGSSAVDRIAITPGGSMVVTYNTVHTGPKVAIWSAQGELLSVFSMQADKPAPCMCPIASKMSAKERAAHLVAHEVIINNLYQKIVCTHDSVLFAEQNKGVHKLSLASLIGADHGVAREVLAPKLRSLIGQYALNLSDLHPRLLVAGSHSKTDLNNYHVQHTKWYAVSVGLDGRYVAVLSVEHGDGKKIVLQIFDSHNWELVCEQHRTCECSHDRYTTPHGEMPRVAITMHDASTRYSPRALVLTGCMKRSDNDLLSEVPLECWLINVENYKQHKAPDTCGASWQVPVKRNSDRCFSWINDNKALIHNGERQGLFDRDGNVEVYSPSGSAVQMRKLLKDSFFPSYSFIAVERSFNDEHQGHSGLAVYDPVYAAEQINDETKHLLGIREITLLEKINSSSKSTIILSDEECAVYEGNQYFKRIVATLSPQKRVISFEDFKKMNSSGRELVRYGIYKDAAWEFRVTGNDEYMKRVAAWDTALKKQSQSVEVSEPRIAPAPQTTVSAPAISRQRAIDSRSKQQMMNKRFDTKSLLTGLTVGMGAMAVWYYGKQWHANKKRIS